MKWDQDTIKKEYSKNTQKRDQSEMATVEPETTPTPNLPPTEEEKTEYRQEFANPEYYLKHLLQNPA